MWNWQGKTKMTCKVTAIYFNHWKGYCEEGKKVITHIKHFAECVIIKTEYLFDLTRKLKDLRFRNDQNGSFTVNWTCFSQPRCWLPTWNAIVKRQCNVCVCLGSIVTNPLFPLVVGHPPSLSLSLSKVLHYLVAACEHDQGD